MRKVHILGGGAIGLALAAHLAGEGRAVVVVRTTRHDVPAGAMDVTVQRSSEREMQVRVETISLSQLSRLEGIIVVTAKAHANRAIATALADKVVTGPLVILQNGLGVERAFLEAPFDSRFPQIHRCVLYTTSQIVSAHTVKFRPIASCPVGIIKGDEAHLKACVAALTTPGFPFHLEKDIQRHIWKKAIINSVFNSICPLLELDNGILVRDQGVRELAAEIIGECVGLAAGRGILLTQSELLDQLLAISRGSDGQWISTLQDIKNGRETEMEYLNLEMARMASAAMPAVHLPRTELLGRMILAKSRHHRVG